MCALLETDAATETEEKTAADRKSYRRVCGTADGPGWAAGRGRMACVLLETRSMADAGTDEKAAAEEKGCRRVWGTAAGPDWAAGRCSTVCALLETDAATKTEKNAVAERRAAVACAEQLLGQNGLLAGAELCVRYGNWDHDKSK